MIRRFIAIIMIVWAGSAWAERPAIDGETTQAFQDARAAWLDGDDLDSLKALKSLSENGNTAAQILFARIAEEPHMHRHLTNNLTRKDRNGFLRQPGGISGKSWLEAARENSDLALHIMGAKVAFTREQRSDGSWFSAEADSAVAGLLSFGETDMATEVAFKLYDGNFLPPALDLLTRYQADLDPITEPVRVSLETINAMFYSNGDQSVSAADAYSQLTDRLDEIAPEIHLGAARMKIVQVIYDESRQAEIKQHAERVRAWRPLAQLCEASCPTTYSDCLLAGAISIGPTSRFPFASPLQSLIPTEDYWSSPRMRADTARRLVEVDLYFEFGAQFDQCFAETVTALAQ